MNRFDDRVYNIEYTLPCKQTYAMLTDILSLSYTHVYELINLWTNEMNDDISIVTIDTMAVDSGTS